LTGEGSYKLPNGNILEGYFTCGEMYGIGIERYIDGSLYEGYFEDNKKDGKGRLIDKDGNIKECTYKYG
jgi:hypothetical protein